MTGPLEAEALAVAADGRDAIRAALAQPYSPSSLDRVSTARDAAVAMRLRVEALTAAREAKARIWRGSVTPASTAWMVEKTVALEAAAAACADFAATLRTLEEHLGTMSEDLETLSRKTN